MEKRQCMMQLTVFADGKPRVKPMIIFKGTVPESASKRQNMTHGIPESMWHFRKKAVNDEIIMKQ